MFGHINKAGEPFKQPMYLYMLHFMNNELVPDTYDYTKLFGLWKGKGSKLDLNMTRYIHRKEWDAKILEALAAVEQYEMKVALKILSNCDSWIGLTEKHITSLIKRNTIMHNKTRQPNPTRIK